MDSRPNIVLIVADDMGYSDLGCYGGEIVTPNVDRLAANGLRFTNFYNNAICCATRASLLTGLYSQQVGGAERSMGHVTMAEMLKTAGYHTLMTGKWHLQDLFAGLPFERGFDRNYGPTGGGCNYFNPGLRRPGEPEPARKTPAHGYEVFAIDDRLIQPYTPDDPDYYTTDAFTDRALEYLDENGPGEDPFFLYMAYTAPHWPLQAWPRDIAKYQGAYKVGWDRLREQRMKRMVEMGLIEARWVLSARDPDALPWDEIEDKDAWDLKMAVYAAMVDSLDQNIGRLMAKIRELGKEENTLVLVLSDNGASDEDRTSTPDIPPGTMDSYHSANLPWGNLSNTPFRKFKRWNHEGGIATPLIAYWPRVITQGGAITHQMGHLIDVMATCADITGADYPSTHNGREVTPLEGKSLLPVFIGEQREGHEALFWNQDGLWRAIRAGKWKLVSPDYWVPYKPWRRDPANRPPVDWAPVPDGLWELYDMDADRTEENNLADKYPDRVREMVRMYYNWERRCAAG